MNKTVSANISGIIFNVEEHAYEKLRLYLDTIRSFFKNSDGRDEIMADIEGRIAELFSERIHERKNVISMSDVESVISIMGEPEQYVDEDVETETTEKTTESNTSSKRTSTGRKKPRRMYRDGKNPVIGGVASGISAYLGWDPVWLRLVFAFAFFLGFGFILYLILWIALPEAKTTAEQLEMHGESVTVQNIGRKVEESIDGISDRLQKAGDKLNDLDTDYYADRAKSGANQVLAVIKGFFQAFGKIIGVAFIFMAISGLIVLLYGLTSADGFITIADDSVHVMSYNDAAEMVFQSNSMIDLAFFGILIAAGIPILALMYAGINLIFNIKAGTKAVGISLAIIWIAGVVTCGFVGVDTGRQFVDEADVYENLALTESIGDTLYIDIKEDLYFDNHFKGHHMESFELVLLENDSIRRGDPYVDVIEGTSDSIEVELKRTSHGPSQKQAITYAKNINYEWEQKGNRLWLAPYYSSPVSDKLRAQHVKVKVKLPVGKTIYLGALTDRVIYDVRNYTDTHDSRMPGHFWTMTRQGLVCDDFLSPEEKRELYNVTKVDEEIIEDEEYEDY